MMWCIEKTTSPARRPEVVKPFKPRTLARVPLFRTWAITCAAATAVGLAGCAVPPPPTPATGPGGCKQIARTTSTENAVIGGAGGAVAGKLLADAFGKSSRATQNITLLGALGGAIAGSQFNKAMNMSELPDGSVKLDIPGAVLFRSGSAELNPSFQQTLNQIASTIREYCGLSAAVVGYTDNVGTYADNQRLSERRAQSVVAYLKAQQVDVSRLTAEGRSSSAPVASNVDEAGRAQNRRVEVFVRPPAS